MNIGIVTTWFERGASYVSRQFMELLQLTDQVFIYARGGENYAKGVSQWDLPNVYWGKKDKPKSILYGDRYIDKQDFHSWIKKNDIQLILFNEQNWFIPLLWCKEWHVRTAAYIDYYTEETIPLYDIYDCLICNTQRHYFAFRNNGNAHYLRWGTNIDIFKPKKDKHDKLVFFNSAGMAPYRKGTDLVIKAFSLIKERRNVKLLIHTQVPLEKEIPDVKVIIEELQKEGSLEIVNQTVPAPGLYYKADIYVYPSRLDGIGLTLMEAEASGLACITIDNAPMNEFVREDFGRVCNVDYYYCRHDGYYWPMSVASVDSLAGIMETFSSGRLDIDTMKRKARDYAVEELDFSKNMSVLHELLLNTEFHTDTTAEAAIKRYHSLGLAKLNWLLLPIISAHCFVKTLLKK